MRLHIYEASLHHCISRSITIHDISIYYVEGSSSRCVSFTINFLSDVGLEKQTDGTLTTKMTKLSAAINNGLEIQKFFTQDNSNTQTNGFALKFAAFAKGATAIGGAVTNKNNALKKALDDNSAQQQKVNDRAAAVEAKLKKQYSALDSKMASLTALSSYVAQQVTSWNQSKN